MTLADFQKYLRSLADALASAKAVNKDLIDAANALTPFAHHSMAEFATFLQLAESTYRENGSLPTFSEKKPSKSAKEPKPADVTADQLNQAIQDIRDDLLNQVPTTRASAATRLEKFEKLPKAALDKVVSELGYKSKAKSKGAALQMIVDRLLAGTIAYDRSQI